MEIVAECQHPGCGFRGGSAPEFHEHFEKAGHTAQILTILPKSAVDRQQAGIKAATKR